jgi:dTDP-4-dehydrorhamnose reductase
VIHLILGKGNLGLDLQEVLTERGQQVELISRSTGVVLTGASADLSPVFRSKADIVWCCVGGYSVAETEAQYMEAVQVLQSLPMNLIMNAPRDKHIILFSSDYAADESNPMDPTRWAIPPKSLYAALQQTKEYLACYVARSTSKVVRVGSLYGHHKFDRTLPGKLYTHNPSPREVRLPSNLITPTWTRWLAEHMMDNLHVLLEPGFGIYHAAPTGCISVADFGQVVLGSQYKILHQPVDPKRPAFSCLGSTLGEALDFAEVYRDFLAYKRARENYVAPVVNITERKREDARP